MLINMRISLIIIFLLFGFILSGQTVLAACGSNEQETDLGCVSNDDPIKFTTNLYGIGLGLIGAVALLSIVYGAFQVLTSQGDPGKIANGKSYIVYAIIGIVLAVGGYSFYRIIAHDVLKIPGFQ